MDLAAMFARLVYVIQTVRKINWMFYYELYWWRIELLRSIATHVIKHVIFGMEKVASLGSQLRIISDRHYEAIEEKEDEERIER